MAVSRRAGLFEAKRRVTGGIWGPKASAQGTLAELCAKRIFQTNFNGSKDQLTG